MLPECTELAAIRLERDWTFLQLAEAMKRAGVAIPMRTLHYHLKRAPAGAKPHDRTLYKIRAFLKHLESAPPRRRRPPKA